MRWWWKDPAARIEDDGGWRRWEKVVWLKPGYQERDGNWWRFTSGNPAAKLTLLYSHGNAAESGYAEFDEVARKGCGCIFRFGNLFKDLQGISIDMLMVMEEIFLIGVGFPLCFFFPFSNERSNYEDNVSSPCSNDYSGYGQSSGSLFYEESCNISRDVYSYLFMLSSWFWYETMPPAQNWSQNFSWFFAPISPPPKRGSRIVRNAQVA
nr:hypothetical protein Iba_chr02aCG2970 [Ipomoea batatas]